MRRLRRFTRPFSVLFALWFAAVLGDPGVLHSCPMHGAGHGAGAGRHAAHAIDAGAAHAQGQHAATEGEQPHAPAPCTCVGHCCATSAAAPLSLPPALHVPFEVLAEGDSLQSVPSVAPAPPTARLPFANGPPAV